MHILLSSDADHDMTSGKLSTRRRPMLTVAILALLPLVPAQDTAAELKKLEGTWKLDKAEANGAELPRETLKQFKLILKGNKYEVLSGGPKDEGTISVDPTKKPKT